MTNYLCLDFGSKRIGLAFKIDRDPIVPSDILTYNNHKDAINQILSICAQKNIQQIIIGLPLSLNGQKGPQAEIIEEFTLELQKNTEIPIATFDERYSSKIFAEQNEPIDNYSAAAILENYLSYQEKTNLNQ